MFEDQSKYPKPSNPGNLNNNPNSNPNNSFRNPFAVRPSSDQMNNGMNSGMKNGVNNSNMNTNPSPNNFQNGYQPNSQFPPSNGFQNNLQDNSRSNWQNSSRSNLQNNQPNNFPGQNRFESSRLNPKNYPNKSSPVAAFLSTWFPIKRTFQVMVVLIVISIISSLAYVLILNLSAWQYSPDSVVKRFTQLVENPTQIVTDEEKKVLTEITQSSFLSSWGNESNIKSLRTFAANKPIEIGNIEYSGPSKKYATTTLKFQNNFPNPESKMAKIYMEEYPSSNFFGIINTAYRWRIYKVDMPRSNNFLDNINNSIGDGTKNVNDGTKNLIDGVTGLFK